MAKEATNKPEDFDGGETPVIDLESHEVKSVGAAKTAEEKDRGESDRVTRAPATGTSDSASTEGETANLAEAGTVGLSTDSPVAPDRADSGEGHATSGDAAAGKKVTQEDILSRLVTAVTDMREGRDALSMRRDLVSLHDKIVPEIQASRDAAQQSEAASQAVTGGLGDLKTLLAKVDGSISGLEGYLLVNLEERLQSLSEATLAKHKSARVPLWLKLAVAGNLLVTTLVLVALLWPQHSQELMQSLTSFSIGDWLTSMEPRS